MAWSGQPQLLRDKCKGMRGPIRKGWLFFLRDEDPLGKFDPTGRTSATVRVATAHDAFDRRRLGVTRVRSFADVASGYLKQRHE